MARELYEPWKPGSRTSTLVARGRAINDHRDCADREVGFAAPGDNKLWLYLRTAITALGCGIETKDWDCVGEAIAMIQDVEAKLREQGI